jgi:hypothetical protein
VNQRRRESCDLVNPRRPDVDAVEWRRQIDSCRANDGVRYAVQFQGKVHDAGIPVELAHPESAPEYDDCRPARRVVSRNEAAADRYVDPQDVEERCGHASPGQLLGPFGPAPVEGVARDGRDAVEHPIALAQLDERRVRKRPFADAALRVRLAQREQIAFLAERQRSQQHGVDDAEDDGVDGDPDGNDRNR